MRYCKLQNRIRIQAFFINAICGFVHKEYGSAILKITKCMRIDEEGKPTLR
jgi:hypothetical protein